MWPPTPLFRYRGTMSQDSYSPTRQTWIGPASDLAARMKGMFESGWFGRYHVAADSIIQISRNDVPGFLQPNAPDVDRARFRSGGENEGYVRERMVRPISCGRRLHYSDIEERCPRILTAQRARRGSGPLPIWRRE